MVKMGIIGWVLYGVIKDRFQTVLESQNMDPWPFMAFVGDLTMTIVTRIGMVYFLLAIFDYFYQKWEFNKEMKMSKKEIKEEYKRLEGDPLIKQRQRDAQRQMAMGRQMGSVPSADVVVTNPIHIAVAIQYKANEMRAPVVIAKGKRLIAEEIKRIAEANYVPVIENIIVAQALYKTTPVGAEIPKLYYKVVAEILAFVYHLKKRRTRRQFRFREPIL